MALGRDVRDEAILFVIERLEGRYSNDPNDPGQETRWGIAHAEHPKIPADVWARFTRADAIAMYVSGYWVPMRCDDLPAPVALVAFDAAVQHGTDEAAILIQRAVGVAQDGKLGRETLEAAQIGDPLVTVRELLVDRALLYTQLKAWPAFKRGWLERLFLVHRHAIAISGVDLSHDRVSS